MARIPISLRIGLWILYVALFCAVPSILGQDEAFTPTEIPSWTETPLSTIESVTPSEPAILTPTETAVPSEIPSATLTQTLAPEPTVDVSPSETAVTDMTETPSSIPTETGNSIPEPTQVQEQPTVEPSLPLLLNDNFDSGDLSWWILGSGWSLIPNDGGQALQAFNSEDAVRSAYDNLFDVIVQARFLINNGAVRFNVRQSAVGSYSISLDSSGQLILYRGDSQVASGNVSPPVGQWHFVRLSAIQNVVRVSIDDAEVIALQDKAPLPPGTITFVADGAGETPLLVDDVMIWALGVNLVAPVPSTSTAIAIPTQIPTEEVIEAFAEVIAPAAPNLTSPLNNAGVNDTTPAFVWRASTGATLYRLQVASNLSFSSPAIDVTATVLSYTPSTSLNYGDYFWRVQARDSAGNWGAWSATRSFFVTILRTPINMAFTQDTTPTFAWYLAPGAARYQLQVATDAAFNALVLDYITPGGSTASYTPPAAAPLLHGLYYWRVNIEINGVFQPAPVVWTLTVTPRPPVAPALQSPTTNTINSDNTPTLSWNSVTDGVAYQVQVDNNSNYTSPEQDMTGSDLSFTTSLLSDGRYYWRVRALNNLNAPGAWSASRYFTVDTLAPSVPLLTAPVNGFSTTSSRPAFSWRASTGAVRYEVQLGTTNPPTVTVLNSTARIYTPPSPLLLTTYFWRVRARDAAGNASEWSELRSVIITSPANDVPRLNRFTASTPILTWGPTTWATSYEIQIDNNSNFSSPEYSSGLIAADTLSHTITTALPNGTWYWRVRARNSAGTPGPWSSTGSFIIES